MGRVRRRAAFVTLLAVAAACAPAAHASAGAARSARDTLGARLTSIAGALRAGDAGTLRAAATREGRVRLDLRGLRDAQGSYGPGQLEVVLGRVFDAFETRSFQFETRGHEAEQATAFARGAWVRRARQGGAEVRETLTFARRFEEGDWRIVELRSSP